GSGADNDPRLAVAVTPVAAVRPLDDEVALHGAGIGQGNVAVHCGEISADPCPAQLDFTVYVADVVCYRRIHRKADLAVHDAQLAVDRGAFSYADGAVDTADVARSHPRAEPDAAIDGFGIFDSRIVIDADPAVDRLEAAVHDGTVAYGYAAVQRRVAVAFTAGLY